MPRIDVNAIAGFADMTPEQKLQAVLEMDIPERVDLTQYVKKTTFDQTAHDLAEAKKKLQGKMSEDELAQAERERLEQEQATRYNELESKYNALLKKSTIAEYTAKYTASGYSPELAGRAAVALVDGKTDDLLAIQAEFQKSLTEKIKADLLADPKGPAGFGAKPGEQIPENERIAREIGKARAEAAKKTNDALSNYRGR